MDPKRGLAEMLCNGVIMDVMTPEQAKIAEEAGACAVMALERIPALIRREGGIARASSVEMIESIKAAVSLPVMAKCRIGHTAEAWILEALEVDFIDESEVLTTADREFHIDKGSFTVPFVCGCRNLDEALRRISEGAALLRSKGEAGTGDVCEAVFHLRRIRREIDDLTLMDEELLKRKASECGVPSTLVIETAKKGRLPVPLFAAGGIATPADAALCMSLGAEALFVGSGIFLSSDPGGMARSIVDAVASFRDKRRLATVATGVGVAMQP
ncbi:MAG: pyridoxal 5'-phosphate synthase lyase subunit PdxS [Simkaniaceae bacterium]|nr:pyridoxal 5'-phosphate synthase lyase subunit PdxS [Simkaniaceae bacterium]